MKKEKIGSEYYIDEFEVGNKICEITSTYDKVYEKCDNRSWLDKNTYYNGDLQEIFNTVQTKYMDRTHKFVDDYVKNTENEQLKEQEHNRFNRWDDETFCDNFIEIEKSCSSPL